MMHNPNFIFPFEYNEKKIPGTIKMFIVCLTANILLETLCWIHCVKFEKEKQTFGQCPTELQNEWSSMLCKTVNLRLF